MNPQKKIKLILILLITISSVIAVYSFPISGPSSINKSELLIVKLNNFFNSTKCPDGKPIATINNEGTYTCGINSDLRTGLTASTGGINFPSTTPSGVNREGSIMSAVRNFFNSTCSSTGQFISGTNSNGQKVCGTNSGANLTIQNQGLTFNPTSPTGGDKDGLILSKAKKFFNTQCSSGTYLGGVETDGSKYCITPIYEEAGSNYNSQLRCRHYGGGGGMIAVWDGITCSRAGGYIYLNNGGGAAPYYDCQGYRYFSKWEYSPRQIGGGWTCYIIYRTKL